MATKYSPDNQNLNIEFSLIERFSNALRSMNWVLRQNHAKNDLDINQLVNLRRVRKEQQHLADNLRHRNLASMLYPK